MSDKTKHRLETAERRLAVLETMIRDRQRAVEDVVGVINTRADEVRDLRARLDLSERETEQSAKRAEPAPVHPADRPEVSRLGGEARFWRLREIPDLRRIAELETRREQHRAHGTVGEDDPRCAEEVLPGGGGGRDGCVGRCHDRQRSAFAVRSPWPSA